MTSEPATNSTREALLSQAIELLADNTGHEITNRVLANKTGVNHALVNYHFGSRQGLYAAVLERCKEIWETKMLPLYDKALENLEDIQGDEALAERIGSFIHAMLRGLITPEIARIFRVFTNSDLVTADISRDWFFPQILSPFHDVVTRLSARALKADPTDLAVMIQGQLIVAQCMTGINARFLIAPKIGKSQVGRRDVELFSRVTVHSVLRGLDLPATWEATQSPGDVEVL